MKEEHVCGVVGVVGVWVVGAPEYVGRVSSDVAMAKSSRYIHQLQERLLSGLHGL